MLKILVVEDEPTLNQMIRDYLETLGWQTITALAGSEALELVRLEKPDFVLLDVMIPGIDGLDVMRCIRKTFPIPIILITARAEESDKLIGLELGADDYITKPFSLKELAARIRAVMRRVRDHEKIEEKVLLAVGDLVLDFNRHTVTRGDQPLVFTAVQFDILKGFMLSPGRVFTRMDILAFFQDQVWEGYERTVDVHIKNIRKILEPKRHTPCYIVTVRGVGYRLMEDFSG